MFEALLSWVDCDRDSRAEKGCGRLRRREYGAYEGENNWVVDT
jgi:hypothetical protein